MNRPTKSVRRGIRVRRLGAAWVAALFFAAGGCAPEDPGRGAGEGGATWLEGDVNERFQLLGDQLAGFSQTMAEVAYRYEEAYWAIQDGNWPYAYYQSEKLGDAVERGIVRRPDRGASARSLFLEGPLPDLLAALETGQEEAIEEGWNALVQSCNACHQAEDVPFIRVTEPEIGRSFVQPENPPSS